MNKFMPQGKIKEVNGSFTNPINAGLRLIVQLCGLDGKYDKPLDKTIAKIWKGAESDYKRWFALQQKFSLGEMKEVAVSSDIWITHLLVRDKEGKLSEEALDKTMKKLGSFAKFERGSIHLDQEVLKEAPTLKELMEKYVLSEGINVYVYSDSKNAVLTK